MRRERGKELKKKKKEKETALCYIYNTEALIKKGKKKKKGRKFRFLPPSYPAYIKKGNGRKKARKEGKGPTPLGEGKFSIEEGGKTPSDRLFHSFSWKG